MEKEDTIFMGLSVLVIGAFIWLVVSDHNLSIDQHAKNVEACENSGGVYIDNMRRMRKYTDHEYVCMNKNMFIFPEGEK